MKSTRKCHGCSEEFRIEELLQYSTVSGKTSYWFCRDCYEKKIEREKFSNKVCEIFGIKSPGPRIWTERKRLKDKFGYTDQVIIDCLEYIYNVEQTKKLAESLTLVRPATIERMMKYKKVQQNKAELFNAASKQEMKEYVVPIKESEKKKKQILNPDDFLDD